jgi:hypothetical protein
MKLGPQLLAALYGVWLLLKLDPRALEFFEKTPGGFARSFLPAVLLVPLHLTHEILTYDPAQTKLAMAPYLVVQLLSDVLSWTVYPFVMIYVARSFTLEARYFSYMVPYNWFQLPLGLMLFPIAIMADLGMAPMAMVSFINLLAVMVFFTFGSFIARIGLQIGVMTSIGLVILDLLLTVITNQLVGRIYVASAG